MSYLVHVPRTLLHVDGRELCLLGDELHVATGLVCLDRQHLTGLHVFVLQNPIQLHHVSLAMRAIRNP